MADDPAGDQLRGMAEHRGLKLVKSRRRKAGTGDYGKFGLLDEAGKPLLGIGADGLTATAQDIEAYLRSGTLGTWQKSANIAPDLPAPKPKASPSVPDAAPPIKPKARAKPAVAPAKPRSTPKPAPALEPTLMVRQAKPADAAAIAGLLNRLSGITIDRDTARQNLAAAQKAGGGFVLAELGKPIGCCGWSVVHTIHRGPIGRITIVFVAEDHRRQGIARQLLAAAEQALARKGCSMVEAISDIQINNAHNFFRTLQFEQTSYRFARNLPD